MGGQGFNVNSQITYNGISIPMTTVADTGANGYLFMDTKRAKELAKFFGIPTRRLKKPVGTKGYDGRAGAVGYSPLYKQTAEELEAAQDYIMDNLSKGFINPGAAPFASSILMARKPGGGLRFCVDYRKLNAITRKDQSIIITKLSFSP